MIPNIFWAITKGSRCNEGAIIIKWCQNLGTPPRDLRQPQRSLGKYFLEMDSHEWGNRISGKCGNMWIWKSGNVEMWKAGNMRARITLAGCSRIAARATLQNGDAREPLQLGRMGQVRSGAFQEGSIGDLGENLWNPMILWDRMKTLWNLMKKQNYIKNKVISRCPGNSPGLNRPGIKLTILK